MKGTGFDMKHHHLIHSDALAALSTCIKCFGCPNTVATPDNA